MVQVFPMERNGGVGCELLRRHRWRKTESEVKNVGALGCGLVRTAVREHEGREDQERTTQAPWGTKSRVNDGKEATDGDTLKAGH